MKSPSAHSIYCRILFHTACSDVFSWFVWICGYTVDISALRRLLSTWDENKRNDFNGYPQSSMSGIECNIYNGKEDIRKYKYGLKSIFSIWGAIIKTNQIRFWNITKAITLFSGITTQVNLQQSPWGQKSSLPLIFLSWFSR